MFNTSDDEEDALGDGEGFTPGDVAWARFVATEGLEAIVDICGTEAGVGEVATVVSIVHCSGNLEAVGVDIVERVFVKVSVEAFLTEEVSCNHVDFHTGEQAARVFLVVGLAKGRVSRWAGRFSRRGFSVRSRAGGGGRNRGFGVPEIGWVMAFVPEEEGNGDNITDVRVSSSGDQLAGGSKMAGVLASDVVEATIVSANDADGMPEAVRCVDANAAGGGVALEDNEGGGDGGGVPVILLVGDEEILFKLVDFEPGATATGVDGGIAAEDGATCGGADVGVDVAEKEAGIRLAAGEEVDPAGRSGPTPRYEAAPVGEHRAMESFNLGGERLEKPERGGDETDVGVKGSDDEPTEEGFPA